MHGNVAPDIFFATGRRRHGILPVAAAPLSDAR